MEELNKNENLNRSLLHMSQMCQTDLARILYKGKRNRPFPFLYRKMQDKHTGMGQYSGRFFYEKYHQSFGNMEL
jgi:hypothetical protein